MITVGIGTSTAVVFLIGLIVLSAIALFLLKAERQRLLRKKAEEELLKEQLKAETVLSSSDDNIVIQDRDYRIIYQNKANRDKFGDRKGEYCYKVYFDRDAVCWECPVELTYADGQAHRVERKGVAEGGFQYIEMTASPLKDAGGNIIAGVKVIRDISDRRKAEDALRESERKYKDLVELSPDIIYRSDRNGIQTFMNDAAFKMLGYSPEEIIGKPFINLIHPEDREKTFMKRKEMLEKGIDAFDFENRYITKSGDAIDVLHNVRVLRDENGQPAGTQGIARDITARNKREEELKLFSAAIEEAMDGVQIVDIEGRIIYSNKAVEGIYGFSAEEFKGRHVNEMNADPDFAGREIIPAIQKTGRWNGELMVKHKNGNVFPIWLTSSLIGGGDGRPIAMVGVIRDITEKRKMEKQLLDYHAHLEELVEERTRELRAMGEQLNQSRKMEAVGQLAGGIAHDFNNRLAAIMNYVSVLKGKVKGDGTLLSYIEHIQGSLDKAAGLTKSLLAFSSKQVMSMKAVSLNAVIKNAGMFLERLIGEDIEMRMALADREITIMADETQIENVLINLATNARDAMKEGGVLTITTGIIGLGSERAEKPGFYAFLMVTDTGAGMDESVRRKIFEPFFTTKGPGKGTGLGLAIVYGIIKQHGGLIEVDSWPGGGSTFRVFLPVAEAEAPHEIEKALEAAGGRETILLVEDDADVRRSTRELLEGAGYTVIEAKDGVDGLGKFEKNKDGIDLLLLDIIMPKLNGKVVCERAREMKPGIRVLFTSGYTWDVLDKKGIVSDINFIPKPMTAETLLKGIRQTLASPAAPPADSAE